MSDHGGTNGDRATVAMVLREVGNLKDLTSANFKTVQVQLEANAQDAKEDRDRLTQVEREARALGSQVLGLSSEFHAHLKDSTERGEAAEDDAKFRRIHWPTFLLAAIAAAAAVGGLFH